MGVFEKQEKFSDEQHQGNPIDQTARISKGKEVLGTLVFAGVLLAAGLCYENGVFGKVRRFVNGLSSWSSKPSPSPTPTPEIKPESLKKVIQDKANTTITNLDITKATEFNFVRTELLENKLNFSKGKYPLVFTKIGDEKYLYFFRRSGTEIAAIFKLVKGEDKNSPSGDYEMIFELDATNRNVKKVVLQEGKPISFQFTFQDNKNSVVVR